MNQSILQNTTDDVFTLGEKTKYVVISDNIVLSLSNLKDIMDKNTKKIIDKNDKILRYTLQLLFCIYNHVVHYL